MAEYDGVVGQGFSGIGGLIFHGDSLASECHKTEGQKRNDRSLGWCNQIVESSCHLCPCKDEEQGDVFKKSFVRGFGIQRRQRRNGCREVITRRRCDATGSDRLDIGTLGNLNTYS